ncbi:MAG: filamentous hemagglutinin N-terminal domain-containing protein, partial [Pseudomonadales bacterium]|nr:filamentous hemagglutinin N-terminal domain-containing protein [Pseudomonadales bacterium]
MINRWVNNSISLWLVFWMAWSPLLAVADVPVPSADFSPDDGGLTRIIVNASGQVGQDMIIEQPHEFNTYNWDSFDIGEHDSVHFDQVSDSASALNYIHQNGASQIFGRLTADGNIYLVNQNGIVFGETALVNVGSLVASSLNIDAELLKNNGLVNSMDQELPLFQGVAQTDKGDFPDDPEMWTIKVSGSISVAEGAQIASNDGGRVVLAGSQVTNDGYISSPDGQVVLVATGESEVKIPDLSLDELKVLAEISDADFTRDQLTEDHVETIIKNLQLEKNHEAYFAVSTDPDLRGLLVEINAGDLAEVTNNGTVLTERGNITLLGRAINQNGVLRATTSVDVNGTIRLLARDQVAARNPNRTDYDQLYWGALAADKLDENGEEKAADEILELNFKGGSFAYMVPQRTGSVTFGTGSVTEVAADSETAQKAVPDAQTQFSSIIDVMGNDITLESDAVVKAQSGIVQMAAVQDPSQKNGEAFSSADTSITLEDGAVIDVSGSIDTVLDMSRNVLEIDLRTNELRDSPNQRDGVLFGETVLVDLRGNRQEIAIADISAAIENTPRTLSERLSEGGQVSLISNGTVDFQEGATVDVSGGEVAYRSGFISETRLVAENGQVVDISDADPLETYVAVLGENDRFNSRWGVVESFDSFTAGSGGNFVQGYVEGADAGSLNVITKHYQSGGQLLADTVVSPYQRESNSVSGGSFDLNLALSNSGISHISIVTEEEFHEKRESDPGLQEINTVYIADSFFSNTANSHQLASSGDFTVSESAAINLDGGGSFKAKSFDTLTIAGDIGNVGGSVSLEADRKISVLDPETNELIGADVDPFSNVILENSAVIDTSGVWVNDNPVLSNSSLNQASFVNAGDISVKASGSIVAVVGDNDVSAQLLANGGAHRFSNGSIVAGEGGDISLAAGNFEDNADAGLLIDNNKDNLIDLNLESYSLSQGGVLSLTDRQVQIGGEHNENALTLASEQFTKGGFSGFDITAGENGVQFVGQVDSSSSLLLQTENYQLPGRDRITDLGNRLSGIATGAKLSEFASTELLHESLRQQVDLNVRTSLTNNTEDASITVGEGVSIETVPGSNITFVSNDSIDFAGQIRNFGGDVEFNLAKNAEIYDDSQAIRLHNSSEIDVSAIAIERIPDRTPEPEFVAYDAGDIRLIAERGYLLAEGGGEQPLLRANGASYEFYNSESFQSQQAQSFSGQEAALDAGSIRLQAAEGILFDGALEARAASSSFRGGSLEIVLNANNRFGGEQPQLATANFTDHALTISIEGPDQTSIGRVSADLLNSNQLSEDITTLENTDVGTAYVNTQFAENGGFDNLTMRAINSFGISSGVSDPTSVATIRFDTESSLSVANRLIMDSPTVQVGDINAQVESNYLAIGTESMESRVTRTQDVELDGSGSFNASANFIDLSGSSAFSDADNVSFSSANDIRLLGRTNESLSSETGQVISVSENEFTTGSLTVYGDLALGASQITPTTGTTFDIDLAKPGATLTTVSTGDSAPVLSAQGVINITASNFVHGGVIKAPFGQVNVTANESISLQGGSVISVSGEGQLVPFGEVLGDGQWVYTHRGPSEQGEEANNLVNELRDKRVSLDGASVEFSEGATIDISGGGDLLAYEFVPGLGGSEDNLLENVNPESFVVIPAYGTSTSGEWGVYDSFISGNSDFSIGQTVYLNGAGSLPAGEYAVLPARYALLPGAYLVTPSGNAGDTFAGMSTERIDGANVVAGKFGDAGIDTEDALWTPFLVEAGSVA